jgi:tRNA(fMet)-specific endonuclease VapC
MQLYMLDTDISSYIIKERPPQVKARLDRFAMEQLCVSVVTKAELLYGVKRCAAGRGIESLIQSREVRRDTSGPSDLPEGESRRGKEHVGEAGKA